MEKSSAAENSYLNPGQFPHEFIVKSPEYFLAKLIKQSPTICLRFSTAVILGTPKMLCTISPTILSENIWTWKLNVDLCSKINQRRISKINLKKKTDFLQNKLVVVKYEEIYFDCCVSC